MDQNEDLKRTVVMLVEDDQPTADAIKALLRGQVFAVPVASSLSAARLMVRAFVPGLVILDRGLPDGDGADFCAELRKDEQTREVPVLFLSARAGEGDRSLGLEAGGDEYLGKPFEPQELLRHLVALINRGVPALY